MRGQAEEDGQSDLQRPAYCGANRNRAMSYMRAACKERKTYEEKNTQIKRGRTCPGINICNASYESIH
jgi:hypothetical protein